MKHEILIAFFFERTQADGALASLAELGVLPGDVSVIPKHVGHRGDLGLHLGSKASEGAAIGAAMGGLLGAIVGALGAAGSLVVPATGSVFAGPVVAAAAGAGVIGAIGVAVGGLLGARHPEFEARLLEDAVGMGGSLVAVRASSAAAGAVERLLEARGASFVRRESAEP